MPVQAPYWRDADLLIAADCVAPAYADFHAELLRGRRLIIACPKLDEGQDVYSAKLTALIDQAKINTLTVVIMEVPCCSGLYQKVQQAVELSGTRLPVKRVVIGLDGTIRN